MTRATVQVELDPPYAVHIGPGVGDEVHTAVRGRALLVHDANLLEIEGFAFPRVDQAPWVGIGPGESAKEFGELEFLLSIMAEEGLDRDATIVALGGGAVLDVAGLAAALYKRGVASVSCPTTLLAMVDASVGGKTAINLAEGKNLVGAFHQPRAVFADTRHLASLPAAEFASGLGEIAKTALLAGANEFELLERSTAALLARDENTLVAIIAMCVRQKARIVASDERERGPRQVLNLGHTFAHAIEHVAGYGVIPHGVAVAVGLSLALRASRACGLLRDTPLVERVEGLLGSLGLPSSLAALRVSSGLILDPGALIVAMKSDKKAREGRVRFVLVEQLGVIQRDVELDRELLFATLG